MNNFDNDIFDIDPILNKGKFKNKIKAKQKPLKTGNKKKKSKINRYEE